MVQLAEWPAAVICAIEEARAVLLDAARETKAVSHRSVFQADEGIRTLDLRHGKACFTPRRA
jgi:hypothetical protein